MTIDDTSHFEEVNEKISSRSKANISAQDNYNSAKIVNTTTKETIGGQGDQI